MFNNYTEITLGEVENRIHNQIWGIPEVLPESYTK